MKPVTFKVERLQPAARIHVLVRLLILVALGAVGCSSLYWILYLLLPALAAVAITQRGSERYLAESAPGIIRLLRFLAGIYAYLWLLTDEFPTWDGPPTVEYEVEPSGAPSAGSALLRLLYSLPALIVLALLSFVGGFLWLLGAIWILVARRLPHFVAEFLTMTLRYQFRLAAYHLSLVDVYPSLSEEAATPAPQPM